MSAVGSGGQGPALGAPYRVVRVVRTTDGYHVVGESQTAPAAPPTTWRILTFRADSRSLDQARIDADTSAQRLGRRVPTWFAGRSYVVDSSGRMVEVTRRPPASTIDGIHYPCRIYTITKVADGFDVSMRPYSEEGEDLWAEETNAHIVHVATMIDAEAAVLQRALDARARGSSVATYVKHGPDGIPTLLAPE